MYLRLSIDDSDEASRRIKKEVVRSLAEYTQPHPIDEELRKQWVSYMSVHFLSNSGTLFIKFFV